MLRILAILVVTVASAVPAQAQDRLIQLGRLWDLDHPDTPALRQMPALPYETAVVAGARFVVGVASNGDGTGMLALLDVPSGTVQAVPGLSLQWTDPANTADRPAVTADPRQPRVFVWHGQRIDEVDTSMSVRTVVSNAIAPTSGGLRRLAYSAEADVLAYGEVNAVDPDVDDLVIVRASTGEPLNRLVLEGAAISLAAQKADTGLLVISRRRGGFASALHAIDLPDGALTPLPLFGDKVVIDETNGRLLFGRVSGVIATDTEGNIIGQLTTGGHLQTTAGMDVSPSTRRTFVQSYFMSTHVYPPGPCTLHVVGATGTLDRVVDLSARLGNAWQPCLGSAFLSAPGQVSAPAAAVSGGEVVLSWAHPGNVEHFDLEVRSGPLTLGVQLGTEAAATFDGVPPGTYAVRVRARNAVGVSAYSPETIVTVP